MRFALLALVTRMVRTAARRALRAAPAALCASVLLVLALLDHATAAPQELRGLWVDGFHPGFRSGTEVTQLVAHARAGGFNALFVEVRRRGDTFYVSSVEPRAAEIDPGFDALQTLIDCAHATNAGPRLEVHAWTVAFNIWNQQNRPPPQADHPYRLHPDWLTRSRSGRTWDGANYAFDPGLPEVQEHTFQAIMEAVRRYDVDGLHLDYIRYAGRDWGYHPRAIQRFNALHERTGIPAPDDSAWLQFRRDQVTALVRKLYLHTLAEKPSVCLSAATIGFAPGITNTVQWTSSAASGHVLQDWRAWMEEGILDWNLPMLYFRHRDAAADFSRWIEFTRAHQYRRRAAAGLGFYLNSTAATREQIRIARTPADPGPALAGVCAYSYATLATDRRRDAFLRFLIGSEEEPGPFAQPAEVPPRPWKTEPSAAHLMGFVHAGADRHPVDGAEVTVVLDEARSRIADATGFYGFVDLDPGSYRVSVNAPGFPEFTTTVTLEPGGKVRRLDLELTRPATPPPE